MLSQKDINVAQRFADLDLSLEELNQLEDRLNHEDEFKDQFEFYLGVRKEILGKVIGDHEAPPKFNYNSRFSKRKNIALVVLGIIALLVGLALYAQSQKSINENRLMADCQSFVKSISSDNLRSHSDDIITTSGISFESRLLVVLDYYNENNLEAAKSELLNLREDFKSIEDIEILEWWDIMILLAEGNQMEANKKLKILSNNLEYNSRNKATELLKKY